MVQELRKHDRYDVRKLPGALLNAATSEAIPCEAVDVSKEGLGIKSQLWIPPQLDVLLVLGTERVELEIVWGVEKRATPLWKQAKKTEEDGLIYRYGLRLTEANGSIDLMEIFKQAGCFD